MATFSTNQAKHLYVVKDAIASDGSISAVGDCQVKATADGEIYACYVGNDGKVRSDLIKVANVISAKSAKADAMAEYLTSAHITVGNVVAAGQHYILKVTINEYGGMSFEDKGFIFADYLAKASDGVNTITAGLALSLAKNATKAAYNPLINVYVATADYDDSITLNTNAWLVTPDLSLETVAAYGSNGINAIIVEGAPQPWTLGKFYFDKVIFDVTTDPVISSGLETEWATIKMNTSHPTAAIVNSKKIADLEWFCAGERGDVYRGMGYPNNFDFVPIVNPTNAYGYHVVDISYYYEGDAEDCQKSPKEIIFAFPGAASNTLTEVNAFIGYLNTAAGTTLVSTLS